MLVDLSAHDLQAIAHALEYRDRCADAEISPRRRRRFCNYQLTRRIECEHRRARALEAERSGLS